MKTAQQTARDGQGGRYVYVATNPAMPGLAKIGVTSTPGQRLRNLFTTAVPLPFDPVVVVEVQGDGRADQVEKALHHLLEEEQVHPKREFYRVEPERLRPLLTLLGTETKAGKEDRQDAQAVRRYRRRRPNLDFKRMGIEPGEELVGLDGSTAKVTGSRKVVYEGREMSLTEATMVNRGFPSARGPCPYWSWNGRRLSEIYTETFGPSMLPEEDGDHEA